MSDLQNLSGVVGIARVELQNNQGLYLAGMGSRHAKEIQVTKITVQGQLNLVIAGWKYA